VLIYLFGSKDGLLREVLAASRERQLAVVRRAMEESAEPGEVLDRLWAWMCEPEHAGIARLFFESYSRSIEGGEPWAGFALDSVRAWEPPLRRILTASDGDEPSDAEVTLTLSVLRGLLLDLLATGEADRIGPAWRRFLDLSWPSTPRTC
jgi:AcrR family transcriptional regulator